MIKRAELQKKISWKKSKKAVFEIEKEFDDSLGIIFEDFKYKHCGNKCLFCFVDQNPAGLRKSLYFKDEDYRLSFLYGNYVTMTNITKKELQRIVDLRLSPLYLSVHSTDVEVRKYLLGIKADDHLLEKIHYLVKNKIELHTQIVLCPGINDGEHLIKSVNDLTQFYPFVKSIAIVPVGLTQFRHRLFPLKAVSASEARQVIFAIDQLAENYKKDYGDYLVYLADEFYLKAKEKIPIAQRYEQFPQMENGVGMARAFIDSFQEQSLNFPHRISRDKSATLVTGECAASILKKFIMPRLQQIENLHVSLAVIKNNFFGNAVSVSGLLTGQDIAGQLTHSELGDLVLLPANCLNFEAVLLDNWTPQQIEKKLNKPVVFVENDFLALLEKLNL